MNRGTGEGIMVKRAVYFIFLTVVMFLVGCTTNAYKTYYTDFSFKYGNLESDTYRLLQSGQKPKIMAGTNVDADSFSMQVSGYIPIGFASFRGKLENIEKAIRQAKRVRATHVLLYTQKLQTQKASVPIPTYQPVTVETSNQGSDASLSKSGRQGNNNNARRRDAQTASYWVKRVQSNLGAYVEEIPVRIQQQAGLIKGCSLVIVVEGTDASRAGLLSGDIVVKFAGTAIDDPQAFAVAIEDYTDRTASLLIYRDGEYLDKTVTFSFK
jgi:hypothetical protein